MKLKLPIALLLLATVNIITGCKKENPKAETQPVVPVQLPESTMFVSTFDSKTGTTIYIVNATDGSITTKYQYPFDANAKWCEILAGNSLLYNIGANKINAININTGKVLWTDYVSNLAKPILHNDTFYGISANTQGTYTVYALDATKASKDFLWQGQVIGETRPEHITTVGPSIYYYDGLILVVTNGNYIAALNAKSGAVIWQANNASVWPGYSLVSLQNGFVTADYSAVNAISGTQLNMVPAPVLPPSFPKTTIQLSVEYLTKENSLIKTRHFDASPGWSKSYLSLVDNATGVEKWHIDFGGGYVNYDSVSYVSHVWNNRLVIRQVRSQGAGKYGVNVWDSYWMTDINTGSTRLKIEDNGGGLTQSSYIVGSTIYLNKRYESTLHGLPYGNDSAPINYVIATDLNTGKQKWNINKLLSGYINGVSTCVYTEGKGFSQLIQ